MTHGFIKGVSVDVSYLKMNDILEYNPPYVQSNCMCNSGPTIIYTVRSEFRDSDV